MSALYWIIRNNPQAVMMVFTFVNAFWIVFTYFNGQRQSKKLESLRHDLRLDVERRKQVFGMKAKQYEAHVARLDAFFKKHQVDLPARMQPVFEEYLAGYMAATDAQNKVQEREVIATFSSRISKFMREGEDDYLRLQAEANGLKLTASDALLKEFNELDAAMKRALQESNDFMSHFTELVLRRDFEAMAARQLELTSHGQLVRDASKALMGRMREDLAEI